MRNSSDIAVDIRLSLEKSASLFLDVQQDRVVVEDGCVLEKVHGDDSRTADGKYG